MFPLCGLAFCLFRREYISVCVCVCVCVCLCVIGGVTWIHFSGKNGSTSLVQIIYSQQKNKHWNQLLWPHSGPSHWTVPYAVVCIQTDLEGCSDICWFFQCKLVWTLKAVWQNLLKLQKWDSPGVWDHLPVWQHLLLAAGRVAAVQAAEHGQ